MEISIKWNVCRICLLEQATGNEGFISLWDIKDLVSQIFDLTGVVIKNDDNLPEKICLRCIKAIQFASNIRNRCLKSDNHLKNILKTTQTATSIFRNDEDEIQNENCDISQDDFEELIDIGVKDLEREKERDDTIILEESPRTTKQNLECVIVEKSQIERNPACKEETTLNNTKETEVHIKAERKPSSKTGVGIESQKLLESLSCSTDLIYDDEKHSESKECKMERYNQEIDLDEEVVLPDCEERFSNSPNRYSNGAGHQLNETNSEENPRNNIIGQRLFMVLNENSIKRENNSIYEIKENDEEITAFNALKMVASAEYLEEVELEEIEETTGDEEVVETIEDFDMNSDSLSDINEIEYLTDDLDEPIENGSINEGDFIDHDSNSNTTITSTESSTIASSITHISQVIVKPRVVREEVFSNSKVVCDKCGNHFSRQSHLNYHMRTHLQPKKFECELCHKRFNAACNLNQHMRTHTGERPYECQYCHRRFTDRSTHVKHLRIHTNEKPFNCCYCGKAFSLSTTLKAHEKIHTGEKPYKCAPCGKAFKLPHHLKAHEKTYQHKFVTFRE